MSAITHSGGLFAPRTIPQQFLYTGVMEIRGYTRVDLADLDPGMVRLRSEESNPLGSKTSTYLDATLRRTNDILAAGVQCLPCVETDGWTSLASFQSYLETYVQAFPEILWWEIGNEPDSVLSGDSQTTANVRKKYLQYMKAASDILDSYGRKLILSAITAAAGGQEAVLDDIDAGVQSTSPSMVDGLAIHAYVQNATGAGGYKDSLYGYRNNIDTHPGFAGKPLWATEIGWPCTYRADGLQHGDWSPGQSNHLGVNQTITLTQQAQKLTNAFNDVVGERHKSKLYLLALIWFAYHDYGIPNGTWDRHCGLLDIADGKRPAYSSLQGYQRQFSIGP